MVSISVRIIRIRVMLYFWMKININCNYFSKVRRFAFSKCWILLKDCIYWKLNLILIADAFGKIYEPLVGKLHLNAVVRRKYRRPPRTHNRCLPVWGICGVVATSGYRSNMYTAATRSLLLKGSEMWRCLSISVSLVSLEPGGEIYRPIWD